MSLTVIKTPGFAIPSISQGILADNGKLLFLSGHFAYGDDGKVTAYDVEGRLAQTFNNLKATLLAANAEPAHVARMTIYIRDYTTSLLPLVRKAIDGFANKECPQASALIGVAALFLPEVLSRSTPSLSSHSVIGVRPKIQFDELSGHLLRVGHDR